jgi:hypothetical protein
MDNIEEERRAVEREAAERLVPFGWVSENKVAGGWGMRVGELADYRKVYLRGDYHWKRIGMRIYYSPEGIEVAKKHFNAAEPEEVYRKKCEAKREEFAKWAPPPKAGTPLSERVCRVLKSHGNPRMIRVGDIGGKVSYIKVRSSTKFREGMLVDLGSCRIVTEEADGHQMRSSRGMSEERPVLYELMIPPPRFVGLWGYDSTTQGYIGRSGGYFKRSQDVHKVSAQGRSAVMWRTVKGQE